MYASNKPFIISLAVPLASPSPVLATSFSAARSSDVEIGRYGAVETWRVGVVPAGAKLLVRAATL